MAVGVVLNTEITSEGGWETVHRGGVTARGRRVPGRPDCRYRVSSCRPRTVGIAVTDRRWILRRVKSIHPEEDRGETRSPVQSLKMLPVPPSDQSLSAFPAFGAGSSGLGRVPGVAAEL